MGGPRERARHFLAAGAYYEGVAYLSGSIIMKNAEGYMEMVGLPHSELRASRLIAGCMGLGGGWNESATLDETLLRQASDFLSAAIELGFNFFDHADIYAYGRAEEIFGRALALRPGIRPNIIIQTKCGIRFADEPQGTTARYDFSRQHIIDAAEGSLRRLGMDYIDILLLHRPDPLWEGEEIAEAFRTLKTSGKVRHFGVSNQNRAQMEYLQSFLDEPLVANQLQMSLLHHDFAEAGISFNQHTTDYPHGWEGVLEYCSLKGVTPQAWSPLDKGALISPDTTGLNPDHRGAAGVLRELALQYGVSAEAIALAWLLRHPARIMPVLGTTRPDRLAACAVATDVRLSREEWYTLFEAVRGRPMP